MKRIRNIFTKNIAFDIQQERKKRYWSSKKEMEYCYPEQEGGHQ
jgi:hypothetical protein